MEVVRLHEGAGPSFFSNSPTGCSSASLPFSGKVWGQEERGLIPQLHGRPERPVSFMSSCCERRLKCCFTPQLHFPIGNLSKCGGRKNPQSCFPTTGTGQVRGARTSQAGLEGGKVEKLGWSSGKQQTEEGVRGKGESRVKLCMPGCCRVDLPAGK